MKTIKPTSEVKVRGSQGKLSYTQRTRGRVNSNEADFTYVGDPNTVFDLNGYYEVGVDANVI